MNTWPVAHRRALVHLEEFESADSTEGTMSGHDENASSLIQMHVTVSHVCDYVSSYDLWGCH